MKILRSFCITLVLGGALSLAFAPGAVAQSSDQAAINLHSTLKFGPLPNIPACITGAGERGDPATGPSTLLLHFAASCRVPWHWHTANETLFIVSGTVRAGMKGAAKPMFLHAGDYAWLPAHNIHEARCVGATPCTLFLESDAAFDIHYVDASGKEIPMSEALKPSVIRVVKRPTKPAA
jgi:quercetin dioxygenase-like cupin family protein